MAIISFTNYKRGQTTGCMGAVMRYTMQDKKTEFEGQQLITGINCQPESVYADFMATKRLHHKTDGVLFYHMVQSFPKGEAVDPVAAHAAALKLAEYYEGYEVLVCTHTDREHIHSHFLINSVNFDTGKKLHIAKEQRTAGAVPDPDADGGAAESGEASGADERTGWEAEREAFFSAQHQATQTAAATPGWSHMGGPADGSGSVASAVVGLGYRLEQSQPVAPVMDSTTMHPHTDRKTLRKERQKKIAQGHAQDDHEEEQTWQQTM